MWAAISEVRNPVVARDLFSSNRPARLWGPTSLLCNEKMGYSGQGFLLSTHPQSSGKVNNGWCCTSSGLRGCALGWCTALQVARSSRSCSQAVWHIPLLCVEWKTADDGQRNCPKHVEFYSNVLILLASCMTYTTAVCRVKNCWWWTEGLSETCRVLFQRPYPARKLYDIYHCCVYSEKLLMMDRGTVRNM